MANSIVFFDGDKGGVGKSTTCAAYIDWALTQQLSLAIVDGDARNPDVGRIFEEVAPVCYANLRDHDGWMDFIDFIHEHDGKTIIVSMPAGIGHELQQETDRLISVAEGLGRNLNLVWVINRTLDSVNLLNSALESWKGKLKGKVVLKNLFFGYPEKFRRWDDSETRKKFEKTGGKTLSISELHERVMDKLFADPNNIMPYSSAVTELKDFKSSPHKLTASENMELATWLKENNAVFNAMSVEFGMAPEA